MFSTVTEASLASLAALRASLLTEAMRPIDTGERLPTGEVVVVCPATGARSVVDPTGPFLWGEGVYRQVRRDRLARNAPALVEALRRIANASLGALEPAEAVERLQEIASAALAGAEGRS